jgi:hypothetical protein
MVEYMTLATIERHLFLEKMPIAPTVYDEFGLGQYDGHAMAFVYPKQGVNGPFFVAKFAVNEWG